MRNGIAQARNTWHSISDAQRHALTFASRCRAGRVIRRRGWYMEMEGARPHRKIGVRTMRNLCARELMSWDGGAFDPEAAAVITERGLFVLEHGGQR